MRDQMAVLQMGNEIQDLKEDLALQVGEKNADNITKEACANTLGTTFSTIRPNLPNLSIPTINLRPSDDTIRRAKKMSLRSMGEGIGSGISTGLGAVGTGISTGVGAVGTGIGEGLGAVGRGFNKVLDYNYETFEADRARKAAELEEHNKSDPIYEPSFTKRMTKKASNFFGRLNPFGKTQKGGRRKRRHGRKTRGGKKSRHGKKSRRSRK